jgi:YidC/Oxa1 family membrane protein insertase
MLAKILISLKGIFGGYGMAIIALTFFVRILLLPLTIKQTKSMREIQRLQPKIKEIQEKFKKDKQKQQEALMKFYQEHKFNPLGGCLPMILQLPIFFALFRVLLGQGNTAILRQVSTGLAHSSFLGLGLNLKAWTIVQSSFLKGAITLSGVWIAVPYLIMVVIMGISQWWSNKIMGGEDPQQARMMNMMLLFMVFIGFTLPAGVIIYWVTTNILTGVQHVLTIRYLPEETPAKA